MEIITRVKEFLFMYNKISEILTDRRNGSPLYHFADYKAQLFVRNSVLNMFISKFDYTSNSFRHIGHITDVERIEKSTPWVIIFESQSNAYIKTYEFDNKVTITSIGNLDCSFTYPISKDEYFNATIGYEIKTSREELNEYLILHQLLNHKVQIFLW